MAVSAVGLDGGETRVRETWAWEYRADAAGTTPSLDTLPEALP